MKECYIIYFYDAGDSEVGEISGGDVFYIVSTGLFPSDTFEILWNDYVCESVSLP